MPTKTASQRARAAVADRLPEVRESTPVAQNTRDISVRHSERSGPVRRPSFLSHPAAFRRAIPLGSTGRSLTENPQSPSRVQGAAKASNTQGQTRASGSAASHSSSGDQQLPTDTRISGYAQPSENRRPIVLSSRRTQNIASASCEFFPREQSAGVTMVKALAVHGFCAWRFLTRVSTHADIAIQTRTSSLLLATSRGSGRLTGQQAYPGPREKWCASR